MRYPILLLAFLFAACTPASKTDEALRQQKVSVLEDHFISAVVIFPLDESITLASGVARAKELLPQFKAVDKIPDQITYDGYTSTYVKPGDADFTLPQADEMRTAMGYLSDDEITSLSNTKANLVFTFFGTSDDVLNKQRAINNLVQTILQNRKAFALDLSTFELFGSDAWKVNRVDNFQGEYIDVTGQVTLNAYREDEFCRIVSLGMNKFCLPEISLRDIPCSDETSFSNLVNATMQSLYESPFIQGDSALMVDITKIKNDQHRNFLLYNVISEDAPKMVTLHLTNAVPEEGDNPSTQLRILFDSEQGSFQEQASEVIGLLFGKSDSITYIKHNEELMQASQEAKSHLPRMQKLFLAGLQPGYSIMVKVPFPTDNNGGNEWMWVEVTKWSSSKMEGILQNDPYEIADLKAGALVKFNEADIFDYLLSKPDGTTEGNTTSEIIEKMN